MSSQRQTIAVADAWAERAEVTERRPLHRDRAASSTFGYKAGFVVGLLRGATILPQLTFDLDDTLATVARERITRSCRGRRRSTSRSSTTPTATATT